MSIGIDYAQLDRTLRESAADRRLDNDEKFELRELGARLDPDRVRYLRNRAFDMARELLGERPEQSLDALRWLEQVVKTLDVVGAVPTVESSAHFTPGDDCLRALRGLCASAKRSADICVYTVSDDRLTEAILACHRRGVAVRVLTDNDKRHDDGSDIEHLRAQEVAVRIDDSPFHMHHKFALFDGRILANGSFNWTRSASTSNEENLVITDDPRLARSFAGQFQALWDKFAPGTQVPGY